jgi:hypothetical protein
MSVPSFAAAHVEWLRARAAIAEINVASKCDDYHDDAPMDAALKAFQPAEWKLLQAPARDLNDIQGRTQIVIEMFAAADVGGEPTDKRHRLMLSALVTEILDYWPSFPAQDGGASS